MSAINVSDGVPESREELLIRRAGSQAAENRGPYKRRQKAESAGIIDYSGSFREQERLVSTLRIKNKRRMEEIEEEKLQRLQELGNQYFENYTKFNYKIDSILNEAYQYITKGPTE